jgi:hypothetical protein
MFFWKNYSYRTYCWCGGGINFQVYERHTQDFEVLNANNFFKYLLELESQI